MTIHPWTITETGAGNNLKSPIFILNDFKLSHEVQRTAEVKLKSEQACYSTQASTC